jgi:hypothetical protein
MGSVLRDLIGMDNGYVKVVSYVGICKTRHKRVWNCVCRCGKEITLTTSQFNKKVPKGCCFEQARPGNKVNHVYMITHG